MRMQLRSLVAAVALVFASSFQIQAVDIYLLSGSSNGSNTSTNFGKIDSTTGAYTNITTGVSGTNIVANLAWNSTISAFYVTEKNASSTNLRTLTTSGTLSTQIGTNIGRYIYAMAYRPTNSTLYAYDFSSDATGTISPTTGGWSTLNANTGGGAALPLGGRYTIQNDTIYIANNSSGTGQFGTIGFTNTSTISQIGSNNSLYVNMVLASDGTTLYGIYGDGTSGAQKLYSINPTNGATTFLTNVSGTDLGTYFYGAGIVSVPEPSTYALCAIATGVMATIARRRKAKKA